jgi:hypothetical protein
MISSRRFFFPESCVRQFAETSGKETFTAWACHVNFRGRQHPAEHGGEIQEATNSWKSPKFLRFGEDLIEVTFPPSFELASHIGLVCCQSIPSR